MTQDAPEPADFTIAVFSPHSNPEQLAELFQHLLQVHPTDAMIWARQLPGILNHTFTAEKAELLTTAIGKLGMHAISVPTAEVPDLRHSVALHHARCGSEGLEVIGLHDVPENAIPWSAIQMVCVGETPLESSHHYSSGDWSGVSAGHHYQSPGVAVPNTPSLQAWITCAPPFPTLRIDHQHMNYEYLASREVESSAVNFKQFIQDLVGHATRAFLTASTQAYLQHIGPERFRFRSAEDFLRYAKLNALESRSARTAGQVTISPDNATPISASL